MYAHKRAVYLAARERGSSKKQARTRAGLGASAPSRIKKLLEETGGIRDRPRSGGPTRYTPDLLEQCYNELLRLDTEEHKKVNMNQFFQHLVSLGLVNDTRYHTYFYKKIVKWGRDNGKNIQLQSTKTQFKIRSEDRPKRVLFAQGMKELLEANPSMDVIFIDETAIEFGPHPKAGKTRHNWVSALINMYIFWVVHDLQSMYLPDCLAVNSARLQP